MKRCFKCKLEKLFSEFYKCKRDGYQSACKSCKKLLKKISDKTYFERNREKLLANNKVYYHQNKSVLRPKMNLYARDYSKLNRSKCNAKLVIYRARKLQAMPSWVSKSSIEDVYRNCPKGYEVDHIIPLRGEEVCGLHVPWNLQYLTRSENASKGNKFEVSHG